MDVLGGTDDDYQDRHHGRQHAQGDAEECHRAEQPDDTQRGRGEGYQQCTGPTVQQRQRQQQYGEPRQQYRILLPRGLPGDDTTDVGQPDLVDLGQAVAEWRQGSVDGIGHAGVGVRPVDVIGALQVDIDRERRTIG